MTEKKLTAEIAQAVNSAAADLNKKIAAHFGAPMNARTLAAVQNYLSDFYADLHLNPRLTQKDLDARAEIALCDFCDDCQFLDADEQWRQVDCFWLAICIFNNSLQNCFATDAKKPADEAGNL